MPREQSVAPKERINIVYKPATGGATAEEELPLKLLVLGDFTLREDIRPLEERTPIKIDKDTFTKVMEEQNLSLSLVVPDKVSGQKDGEMSIHLPIRSEKDFSPDHIIQHVPELQTLLQIREALQWLRGPLGNRREFRKRIEGALKDPGQRQRLYEELGLENPLDEPTASSTTE